MATIKDCNRALKRLPEHARGEAQQTVDTTAFHISRGAEQRAPVGVRARRRVRLRGAITWKSRPRSVSAVVLVDAEAFHWKFLEYGTVKMQARPMFRPAAEAMAADHDQRMAAGLQRALTKMEQEAR